MVVVELVVVVVVVVELVEVVVVSGIAHMHVDSGPQDSAVIGSTHTAPSRQSEAKEQDSTSVCSKAHMQVDAGSHESHSFANA